MKKTINKMWKVCMEKLNRENFDNGNLKAVAALILAVILTIGDYRRGMRTCIWRRKGATGEGRY